MIIKKDVFYTKVKDSNRTLDLYMPTAFNKVFIYFHGGGLEAGDKAKGVEFIQELVEKYSVAVITANYRMYPTAKYPQFLLDGASVVKWAFKNVQSSTSEPLKFFVGGSSAGGYISQMLCFNQSLLNKHGISPTQITAYFHDAGQPTTHFNVLREHLTDTRRIIVDKRSSLYYVGTSQSYSPMIFIASTNDMPCRLEQTILAVKALNAFGHKNVELQIVDGTHCEYVCKKDQNGSYLFANMIGEYISRF
ncbi:MAG: alpha/beta hydrolase fold domain-containing protein [Clostridia bacterium]|nr:alpha/beta hydrolase fold domain-containing protein [Clostridia bacterium]